MNVMELSPWLLNELGLSDGGHIQNNWVEVGHYIILEFKEKIRKITELVTENMTVLSFFCFSSTQSLINKIV